MNPLLLLTISLFFSQSLFGQASQPRLADEKECLLEGQKWIYRRTLDTGSSEGNSWTFLPNNRFMEEQWYSGGAYFRVHFSGTFDCQAGGKTVFLKYNKEFDKGEIENIKGTLKERLDLIIIGKDTILTITKDWEKPEESLPITIPENIIGHSSFHIERTPVLNKNEQRITEILDTLKNEYYWQSILSDLMGYVPPEFDYQKDREKYPFRVALDNYLQELDSLMKTDLSEPFLISLLNKKNERRLPLPTVAYKLFAFQSGKAYEALFQFIVVLL